MKVLSIAETRAIEEQIIAAGTSADQLMERAGALAAAVIAREFPDSPVLFWIGKGNNGGDGLVTARYLAELDVPITLALAQEIDDLGDLCRKKLDQLRTAHPDLPLLTPGEGIPWPHANGLVVDALLGTGARGPLTPALSLLVTTINRERSERFFRTVAIDGPTGLHEGNEGNPIVTADLTLSIGCGKTHLFAEQNSAHVGRITILPIFNTAIPAAAPGDLAALEPDSLRPLLQRRSPHSHKNQFGRVLLVGGSRGFTGAPLISAHGALKIGAGLVHIAVRPEVYPIAAAQAPLEAMVSAAEGENLDHLLGEAKAIAVGPGLGTDKNAIALLRRILEKSTVPLVLDADALTILSRDRRSLAACRDRAILTPHPGEMTRLLEGKKFSDTDRLAIAHRFAEDHGLTLVLKGTRTLVTASGQPLYVNTTGNAGLATGGSGDLLTGILAGLLGQGLTLINAARIGVWLHGRAADLALQARGCEEGLSPVEVSHFLASGLTDLRQIM